MTTIKNTETNEIVEIRVIDPKSGNDWSSDLVGNACDDYLIFSDDDDYDYEADAETTAWWVDYCNRYETADHKLYDALRETESCETDHEYEYSRIGGTEFNDLPEAMVWAAERSLKK